jgi:phosphoadenosine phosphosulfate reductase
MVQIHEATPADLLLRDLTAAAGPHGPAAFSSSLSAEDMVITDVILTAGLDIEIFTIDTGRLHEETLELLDRIRDRYRHDIRVYAPEAAAVAAYVGQHGRDAFYQSFELRRECCHLRKVEPLKRALAGKRAWITGLRQVTGAREHLARYQFDETHGAIKFNPLASWSETEVWDYLRERDVPYNRLYDHGYRSIGCAPCTRPTLPTEDVRAGRWWWEQGTAKECGLHVDDRGRLVREREVA